jgi:hypothetical protein
MSSNLKISGQTGEVVRLVPEDFPDLLFTALQIVVPDRQRVVLVPGSRRGPAELSPPGVPATPRP